MWNKSLMWNNTKMWNIPKMWWNSPKIWNRPKDVEQAQRCGTGPKINHTFQAEVEVHSDGDGDYQAITTMALPGVTMTTTIIILPL